MLKKLEDCIFYKFHNKKIFEQALTHSSYSNEKQQATENNERLEFLGDAVLDLAISELLIKELPEEREGALSKIRSQLVREESLVNIANKFKLGNFLILGKGEEKSGGRTRPSVLSGALEALVGAIFLDGGYSKALNFIKKMWSEEFQAIHDEDFVIDYKTRLQELIQAKYKTLPIYRLLKTKGPAHNRSFSVELNVNGSIYLGQGRNKKEAEQGAAKSAWEGEK